MTTLKQLRTRIAALQSEGTAIERQQRSRSECATDVVGGVAQLKADFDARAGLALRRIAAGHAPAAALRDVFSGPDALARALVGIVGAATVADALLRQHDTVVPEGLDAAARAARLAEIAAELDRLEADEERLIEASEAAGAPIERRPDARPEIILAVGAV